MNIILVTDGEYSDYRIMGAFSTREKAQEYIDILGGQIEEYETDINFIDTIPNYKEGFLPYDIRYYISSHEFEVTQKQYSLHANDTEFCMPYGDSRSWMIKCIASDKQHAVKIASERISQIIALNLIGASWQEYTDIQNNITK